MASEPHRRAQEKLESAAQLPDPDGVSTQVSSATLNPFALAELQLEERKSTSRAVNASKNGKEEAAGCPDSEVMLRVKAGDRAAFDLIVQKFRRPMVGFMYRMVRNPAIAEELAQEVFLRIYRSRQSYAAEARFSTWLYRIATNLALNHLRDTRGERQETSISLEDREDQSGRSMDFCDGKASVEENLLRRERSRSIRKHVEELPERQRMAVVMHKYQNLGYREIAKVLRMSESATKSLLFRAYEKLREQLKDFA